MEKKEEFTLARLSYPDPTQLSGPTQWVLAQLPVPLHAPDQPEKLYPEAGAAVKSTMVPPLYI